MSCRIGVDESGKGDYFGYLVTAAVHAGEKEETLLAKLGVKDSKKLSDAAVKALAPKIKKCCLYDVVKISPEKYNLLYKKFHSLNLLLAWTHARAIENVLEKVPCTTVICDKFGSESLIAGALMEKGKGMHLVQKTNAESDIAVAAASVLARDEFLRTLRSLGRLVGFALPKGATHVEKTARDIMQKHGADVLDKVAKVHFRTTRHLHRRNAGEI